MKLSRLAGLAGLVLPALAFANEANLVLPDLASQQFMGIDGRTLLMIGILVSAVGLAFGGVQYMQLKNLPVHKSMLEISELIYETCKQYMVTQGKFIMILELFIGAVIAVYFSMAHVDGKAAEWPTAVRVLIILGFSLIGIAGSYGVAWYGIRVNTFANSRTAFASLRGKPFPTYDIPLKAGMSIGMMLISVELLLMLMILELVLHRLRGR